MDITDIRKLAAELAAVYPNILEQTFPDELIQFKYYLKLLIQTLKITPGWG